MARAKCQHIIGDKHRVGPTGKKLFTILIERCFKCGILIPVKPEQLSYKECKWIERWNNE